MKTRILSRARNLRFLFATRLMPTAVSTAFAFAASAQDGKTGIQQASSMVGGYFDVACTLMYAVGGVVGVIGAVKVYNAWSHGDQQTNKLAASWFGACIFLVVVAAVLKSFFNLS